MEFRHLGKTGLATSTIGMGTWRTFDVPVSSSEEVETRRSIVDEAISAGVNLFDSSPMYGSAEEVLGKTLEGRRDRVLVATKVWSPSVATGREQIENALRFYSGYVDVYQIHNLVAWREYLPILRSLRDDRKVRAIGITHYAHSAFSDMRRIMETENIQAVQIPYNAADTLAADEILPLADELDIGVVVMSPLGTGDLLRSAPAIRDLSWLEGFGISTWAQALLKWVVSDPRVDVTIPATSRPGRMTENAAAGNPPFFGPEERERVSWLARRLAVR